jgi:hypothetical protein
MTEVYRAIIPTPPAWTGAELGDKEALVLRTGAAVRGALDRAAVRLRGRALPSITRADLAAAPITELMSRVRHEVMHGRGIAIVRGPEPSRYDPHDYERLYWGLGAHLGKGVVQSYFGDYLARVERNPDLPWRGTTTDMELRPHTDFHELMSLASVSLPASGGVSGFVSALAVHNEILGTRPELLAPLYQGWYQLSPLHRIASAKKVPIFCQVHGQVSCFYNRVFFQRPEDADEEFPAALTQAMAYMDAVAARDDMLASFTLQPGEMVFWHNFLVMHARSAFQDTEQQRRLLLRLWLNVTAGRPIAEEIAARARIVDRDHAEGRRSAVASP